MFDMRETICVRLRPLNNLRALSRSEQIGTGDLARQRVERC